MSSFAKAAVCTRCPHARHKHGTFGCLDRVNMADGTTRACPCPHQYGPNA